MDRIYYNGTILTMRCASAAEELRQSPHAVLVRDGLIAAVGDLNELPAKPDAEYCDLRGRCLLPGFIDPHSHFVANGQMALRADLSDCGSFDDIVRTLRSYHEINAGQNVIIGFGYDHNFLKEGRHPDRHVLDMVSTELPVCIQHVSLHFACVNSAALNAAGLDAGTPDPEGGKFGRLENGELSGYLEEKATGSVSKALNLSVSEYSPGMIEGMQEAYLRYGITTVQEGSANTGKLALLDKLAEAGALKPDVVAYATFTNTEAELPQRYPQYAKNYRNHVRIGGYKIFLDGSPQGRSAWMSRPYLGGDPGYCGYPRITDEQVQRRIETALSERRQILAHCNGDAASEQFITAYERAIQATGVTDDLRPVMVHCQTVRNDQLDRMRAIRMIASIFVGHVWYWGDVHVKNFGEERGSRISPAKDAIERGLHVNFHQDTPVTKPNMLHSVWCAVNRLSRGGNVIGEDQKISVYDALRAVTVEGAYEYFEEREKGTIEVGKRADLVILDKSPLDVPEIGIKDIKVCETIKDGVTVYKNPSC